MPKGTRTGATSPANIARKLMAMEQKIDTLKLNSAEWRALGFKPDDHFKYTRERGQRLAATNRQLIEFARQDPEIRKHHDELRHISRLSNPAACPPGKIRRKGYTTRRGTRVASSCIVDRGKPGKGPDIVPNLREGKLGGPGYTEKSQTARHKILKSCIAKYGYKSCLGSLQYLLLVGANTWPKSKLKVVEDDKAWLMKKYRIVPKTSNPGLNQEWVKSKSGFMADDVSVAEDYARARAAYHKQPQYLHRGVSRESGMWIVDGPRATPPDIAYWRFDRKFDPPTTTKKSNPEIQQNLIDTKQDIEVNELYLARKYAKARARRHGVPQQIWEGVRSAEGRWTVATPMRFKKASRVSVNLDRWRFHEEVEPPKSKGSSKTTKASNPDRARYERSLKARLLK